ncbi:hypothetical protein K435DRAFT_676271, partial [Dendrothele bispora CBS 962.96]
VATCSLGVVGQPAFIESPTAGSTLQAGSNVIIRVEQPNSITRRVQVAIVLRFVSCPDNPQSCLPPDAGMGTVLYDGPFNPQFGIPFDGLPPHVYSIKSRYNGEESCTIAILAAFFDRGKCTNP